MSKVELRNSQQLTNFRSLPMKTTVDSERSYGAALFASMDSCCLLGNMRVERIGGCCYRWTGFKLQRCELSSNIRHVDTFNDASGLTIKNGYAGDKNKLTTFQSSTC